MGSTTTAQPAVKAIADTGATDTLVRTSDSHVLSKLRPTARPFRVALPNGSTIESSGVGDLQVGNGEAAVSVPAHVFPDASLGKSLLALSDLCNRGLHVLLTDTSISAYQPVSGEVVLQAAKGPSDKLWPVPLTLQESSASHAWCGSAIRSQPDAEFVLFTHACFGSPATQTFLEAARRGYLSNWPRITSAMIAANPPHTIATARGHLSRVRQGIRSTRPNKRKKQSTQRRQEQASAAPMEATSGGNDDLSDDLSFELNDGEIFVKVFPNRAGINSSDLPGRLPVTSRHSNNYLMVSVFRKYVHVEPMASRHAACYVKALAATHLFFQQRGHRPAMQKLDNETSSQLKDWIASQPGLVVQYVPPDNHRANPAERAIRTFKDHFVTLLATTDPDMPLFLWEDLLPQAEITLNHLRGWGLNPAVSAWHGLHGTPFDFAAHPLYPPGCAAALIFEDKSRRFGTWGSHGVHGFYLGPLLEHYRCWRVFATTTSSYRKTDTLELFPAAVQMPGSSYSELFTNGLKDMTTAMQGLQREATGAKAEPLRLLMSTATEALKTIGSEVLPQREFTPQQLQQQQLQQLTPAAVALPPISPQQSPADTSVREQRVVSPPGMQRVATPTAEGTDNTTAPAPLLLPAATTIADDTSSEENSSSILAPAAVLHAVDDEPPQCSVPQAPLTTATTNNKKTNRQASHHHSARRQRVRFAPTPAAAQPTAPASLRTTRQETRGSVIPLRHRDERSSSAAGSSHPPVLSQAHNTTAASALKKKNAPESTFKPPAAGFRITPQLGGELAETAKATGKGLAATLCNYVTAAMAVAGLLDPSNPRPALNLDGEGNPLTFRTAIRGPDAEAWRIAEDVEFRKLIKLGCIRAIHSHQQPEDRRKDTTYYNRQVKEKQLQDGTIQQRVRGAAGGNIIHFPGDVSAGVAEMELVKAHIHSVASDRLLGELTKYMNMDITDYYLGAPLPRPEYMRIPLKDIPPQCLIDFGLEEFISGTKDKPSILFEIVKCLWGLPQSGLLSQQRLVGHLNKHGYFEDENVPCLFTHATRRISFTLVVDDFGVKYIEADDVEHLAAAIRELYTVKLDWSGTKYLGYTIDWDDTAGTVSLSMPAYIPKLLERFCPNGPPRGAPTPSVYVAPTYGQRDSGNQLAAEDTSRPLTEEERHRLQEIAGSFLFYARAVDPTMLTTVCELATHLKAPTENVLKKIDRLLAYAVSHPCHKIVYKACDMILYGAADASYLSRTESRSVAGGLFFFGNRAGPDTPNGPLLCFSGVIPTVVSAVSEAEYAALFMLAQHGTWLRVIAEALGYKQPPTVIICDSAVAVGIASKKVKLRRSKTIWMRYHWIRNRISLGEFAIVWRAGITNPADFFTKPLPTNVFKRLAADL